MAAASPVTTIQWRRSSSWTLCVERWKTPNGLVASQEVLRALGEGDVAAARAATRELPGSEEVAPALDLRGLDIRIGMLWNQLDLRGVRCDGARLTSFGERSDVSGGSFRGAKVVFAGGYRWRFGDVDLRGADLGGVRFRETDLTNADLTGARLVGAQIWNTRLTGARLCDTQMRRSDLKDCALEGADFSNVDFDEACVRSCTVDEATKFTGASVQRQYVDPNIAERCLATGGTVRERQNAMVAGLDGVIAVLGGATSTDPLVSHLLALRPKVVADGGYDWGSDVLTAFPDAKGRLVAAIRKAELQPWTVKGCCDVQGADPPSTQRAGPRGG